MGIRVISLYQSITSLAHPWPKCPRHPLHHFRCTRLSMGRLWDRDKYLWRRGVGCVFAVALRSNPLSFREFYGKGTAPLPKRRKSPHCQPDGNGTYCLLHPMRILKNNQALSLLFIFYASYCRIMPVFFPQVVTSQCPRPPDFL